MKPAKNDLYDRYPERVYEKTISVSRVSIDGLGLPDIYGHFRETGYPVLQPWTDSSWEDRYGKIVKHGLCSPAKIVFIQELLKNVTWQGEIWECGTLNGTTAKVMHMDRPDLPIRLFDTFKGISGAGENDIFEDGDFHGDPLHKVQYLIPEAAIHAGIIPETFGEVADVKIAFAHIDLDLYQPTIDSLNEVYRRMDKGFIVVDDYGNPFTTGVKIAVDEFLSDKPEFAITQVTSQCLIIKGL